MQEWMIAMLVISIMLIIRDMAKTILAENLPDTEELLSLQENHPQKERVEKYAASFQKLADTFYGMPYRKDYLSSRQIERIIEDTNTKVCSRCYQREICWGEHSQELGKGVEALVRSMESGNEDDIRSIRSDWTSICPRSVQYYEAVVENFQREKQNLMWDNRMIENRLAVAQQLMEVSRIMENVASDLYDLERGTPQFRRRPAQKSAQKPCDSASGVGDGQGERPQAGVSYYACKKWTMHFHDRNLTASLRCLWEPYGACEWKQVYCKRRISYRSFC